MKETLTIQITFSDLWNNQKAITKHEQKMVIYFWIGKSWVKKDKNLENNYKENKAY